MIYIDTVKLPDKKTVSGYFYLSCYPWNIFFNNQFEWAILKDITIFYGNNGSGKSTMLNIIAEKINARRTNKLYKDKLFEWGINKENEYNKCPFDDFLNDTFIKLGHDDNGKELNLPLEKRLITSDDIFKKIDERAKHNLRRLEEGIELDNIQDQIINKGYTYKTLDDYEDLVKFIEALKLSKTQYKLAHSSLKKEMRSNGETALDFFNEAFEDGGIYLLDEPENCLSPIYQIELIKLIEDSVKYFNCQFIIATHSPFILSINSAVIYNMDLSPVLPQRWEELENVKIYYNFFKSKENKFIK